MCGGRLQIITAEYGNTQLLRKETDFNCLVLKKYFRKNKLNNYLKIATENNYFRIYNVEILNIGNFYI